MKTIRRLWVVLLLVAVNSSCNDEPPAKPTNSNVNISFVTSYFGTPLFENNELYTNAHGEMYSISLLRYYISHITLVKNDGTEVNSGSYDLVDPFDETLQNNVLSFPVGDYKEIKFYFGVPQPQNHIASSEGELNTAYGMAWTWNFGYIFFKHEGSFRGAKGTGSFSYHLGTDPALQEIVVPLTITLDGSDKYITIEMDLQKVYSKSNTDIFSDNPVRHSTSTDDKQWISTMSQNIASSFDVKLR